MDVVCDLEPARREAALARLRNQAAEQAVALGADSATCEVGLPTRVATGPTCRCVDACVWTPALLGRHFAVAMHLAMRL